MARPKKYSDQKEYNKGYSREKLLRYKKSVFDNYGWKCNCCNESTPQFLTVDHVDNDGFKDRIGKKRRTGLALYMKIVREGYGERYQILCANCNHGKNVNKGICPHKSI